MWNQINDFSTLAYIALKDDAIHRGMGGGDARIFAASQANAWAGMVSPDRWMNSPAMYNFSRLALFAPNWWRTFPRIILNSYDHMGMKSDPALTHAWALNTAKTIGAMVLLKGATDNALNWLMSGHWQWQNEDGYKGQITMDRFGGVDPKTGAHLVMENPFERQVTDLETVLGITEAMKMGHWRPEYAAEGMADVAAARVSPLVNALETASNIDVYNTIKNHALRWVDPLHQYPGGGFETATPEISAAAQFAPFGLGYLSENILQGVPAQDGTLTSGPFAGTKIPGWAMRAFDPNDPLVPILSLLGVRGGYPSPIKNDEVGLSSSDVMRLTDINNAWTDYLTKQQTAVMSGGKTFSEFAYDYKSQASYHAGQLSFLNNTSEYMHGSAGLLAQYEAIYNDKQATDSNGDINWAYIDKAQGALQAKTDPATWRQMMSLKNQREMQFPVLRAYKDSLQNYKNFQDTWAKSQKPPVDPETLRSEIAGASGASNYYAYEAAHPDIAKWTAAKRAWEMNSKQGFAYGMFTNNRYVMDVIDAAAGGSTTQQVSAEEDKVLPEIESEEKAGKFVTPTGQ